MKCDDCPIAVIGGRGYGDTRWYHCPFHETTPNDECVDYDALVYRRDHPDSYLTAVSTGRQVMRTGERLSKDGDVGKKTTDTSHYEQAKRRVDEWEAACQRPPIGGE
jgi:hypothetical protein